MADFRPEEKHMKRKSKKRKLRTEEKREEPPSKASRIELSTRENEEPKQEESVERETSEIPQYCPPWRNLQLILSLQNKQIEPQRKVELAHAYVKSRVSEGAHQTTQDFETVSISRVVVSVNNWVQSLLISSEKKSRDEGNIKLDSQATGSYLDYRCWEIFRFCLEESLKMRVPLSLSRDFLRVIHCIAGDALSRLSVASLHQVENLGSEILKFYNNVLSSISCIFDSHGGVSNENLDLWVLVVEKVLELARKVLEDRLDDSNMGIFALQFFCVVIEPFARFLRVHPTRKNGFHDFVDKLLEPLLHLIDVLHQYTRSSNSGWAGNLLKLVEEVLSQGLFHPTHIDGFLSLQSLTKYKTSDYEKVKDSKTVVKSYHRHLFEKLEKIMSGTSASSLGGIGELFGLFINCVKNQKGIPVREEGAGQLDVENTGQIFKSGLNSETRKSVIDFFVQIMEPLLVQISTYLEDDLEVGLTLSNAHCTIRLANKILVSFMHESVYVRTEDTYEGACVNFLKAVYEMIMSFSAKINQVVPSLFGLHDGTHKEVINLITKELIVAVKCLLEIEYEVVGNDLERLWLMTISHGASGLVLMDMPKQSLLTEIIHLGCQVINLYSELRQVSNSVFALCKAVRRFLSSARDGQMCKLSLYYESYAKSVGTLLCSQEFRLSIYNAIKIIPEGQASKFIRKLTVDISESLVWMKGSYSIDDNGSFPCLNIQAEVLGSSFSELYTLILDSVTVTAGNSSLVGVSMNDLMAVIRPNISNLVGLDPSGVSEFVSTVIGEPINMGSTHWVVVFFFRLYMSSRSLYRQAVSLVGPDMSRKMSEIMDDSFTAYSGRDWLERNGGTDEGYFSWIVQPSASLLTTMEAVLNICVQDAVAADCSTLIYVMNAMVIQRLVDLNKLIKSFEYLLQMNSVLNGSKLTDDAELLLQRKKGKKSRRHVSDLRQEAAELTGFMMKYVSLVETFAENDSWDFSVGAINGKSLPAATWWMLCKNIDVWCAHAAKKKLKMFISLLIQNSLPDSPASFSVLGKHMKTVNVQQISFELLSNAVFYEQKFACRHMASRICKLLENSVSPLFKNSGEIHLTSPPDWSKVLDSFENSSIVVSDYNYVVNPQSSGAELLVEINTCQRLLKFLCWMPKGSITTKSFSRYTTCILNLERLLLGALINYRGGLQCQDHFELFKLFMSCRRALKNLTMASIEGKMESSSHSSLTPTQFKSSFPSLWLLKSLSAVIGLQHVFPDDSSARPKEVIFSLIDHTSYVFLAFGKDQFMNAIHLLGTSLTFTEDASCLDSSKDLDAWDAMVVVAKTLKDQTALYSRKVELCVGFQELTKLSSTVSCFQGFLWGLASALDQIDGERCNLKSKLPRWKFEPFSRLVDCIDTFADFISRFLKSLFLEDDDKLPQNSADAQDHPMSDARDDLGHDNLFGVEEQQNSQNCESNRSVGKTRARRKNEDVPSFLTKVDSFDQQCLNRSLLLGFLRGENIEAAFFLGQLFIAYSAILRVNLHIKRSSSSASLVPIFVNISEVFLLEFSNTVETLQPLCLVWLDGIAKFLGELGSQFPLTNATLTNGAYAKLIHLHVRAIGKCISLQGKRAALASHETESSIKTLKDQRELSESTLSCGSHYLDEFKLRLRMSFKIFLEKSLDLHLLSAIKVIERALVGVQQGCVTNYEICTGSSDGGKVSSTVAAGIDCLDLILEYVKGSKRLSVVKSHIQSLVACLFNIILHVRGSSMFLAKAIPNRGEADPDQGSVILMSIEVLNRIFGKHALFQMDACHVSQSLSIPGGIFRNFLQRRISEAPDQSNNCLRISVINNGTEIVDRQFSIELYAACCRLLCTVLKHHKSESQRCVALLDGAVYVLLCCLEMVDVGPAVRKDYFAWNVQEAVKCAHFLRRIYEEIRQQKDVYSRQCFQFLSNYIWIYSGYGPLKTGIRREIDEALRPGVYALIDACSADELQHIHTVFGEGPCRSTLASLQHDYKLNFQYEGKV